MYGSIQAGPQMAQAQSTTCGPFSEISTLLGLRSVCGRAGPAGVPNQRPGARSVVRAPGVDPI